MPDSSIENPGGYRAPLPTRSSTLNLIDSKELFRGKHELQIKHVGEIYTLRITRNGKLILNK